MNFKSILECEKKELEKLRSFQLPHFFKKVAVIVFAIAFVALFVNAFTIHNLILREIIKYVLLLSLLFISISKDKIEDEFIKNLRLQAFAFAFIFGVIYTLIQPVIHYAIDLIYETDKAVFKDIGDFEILLMLLLVQVLYFETLKRLY